MATRTPWGDSTSTRKIARGIMFYVTSRHGGFHLSQARLEKLPFPLYHHKPWAGKGWYEEDLDWVIVVAGFPQYFDPKQCKQALQALQGRSVSRTTPKDKAYFKFSLESYLGSPQGVILIEKANQAPAS